jgi:hypothetical protein
MYKPPESHVTQYEQMLVDSSRQLSEEDIHKAINDIQWMLQTNSYRTHYLDRLEVLELSYVELLDGT